MTRSPPRRSSSCPTQAGRLRVTITVAAGQPLQFRRDRHRRRRTPSRPACRATFLPLEPGAPIRAVDVEAAEANVLLRLPQQGYPFPELGLRDIVLDPDTRPATTRCRSTPGPRARFGGFTTEGDLAFDAAHVGVLARFRRGETLRPPQGRRSARGDGRDPPVQHGLGRAGADRRDGRGRHPICQHPGPPGCRPGALARRLAPATAPARASGSRRAWEHRNLFPPEGALRIAAIAGTAEQNLSVRFRRNNWGKRDRALLLQFEAGAARFRGVRGLYRPALRPGQPRIDADLAEALDLCLWRRDPRHQRESQRHRDHLALRRLFHRRADRPARLRPLEQPARSDQRLPPARPGQSGGLAAQRHRLLHPQPDRRQRLLSGRRELRARRPRPLRLDLRHRRATIWRRRGGSMRAAAARCAASASRSLGPRDLNNVPLGGRSLSRVRGRGPLPLRQLRRGRLRRRRPGLRARNIRPSIRMRFGVGVGGRVYTNFGPVRVDVATPIGRRPGESRINVYVSIGQAF